MSYYQYPIKPSGEMRKFRHVAVPMRDGVKLSADITLPAGDGPFPAILVRTPYDSTDPVRAAVAVFYAANGYAGVLQDVRGRGDSQGEWEPWINETRDGYDTIEWIATQPWCTGKVGFTGGSYMAHVIWEALKEHPPHLVAAVSRASAGEWLEEPITYMRGIFPLWCLLWEAWTNGRTIQMTVDERAGTSASPTAPDWARITYHLPPITMDQAAGFSGQAWQEWLEHPPEDAYWDRLALEDHYRKINIPMMHMTGWFDGSLQGTEYAFKQMAAQSKRPDEQWLIIGPWDHPTIARHSQDPDDEAFGPEAYMNTRQIELQFFDHFLKGEGSFVPSKAQLFDLGEKRWHAYSTWPPPEIEMVAYYLDSAGAAHAGDGHGRLGAELPTGAAADHYTYDPVDPTPSWPNHREEWGQVGILTDQRWVHEREDVLVYASDETSDPVQVAGRPVASLFVSSDAPDTDFFVSLCDVHPDGGVVLLSYSGMRARYRKGSRRPELMTPGEVYELRFELGPVHHLFLPGHRMLVEVRSAHFPAFLRNLNTGEPVAYEEEIRVAQQTVYHDGERASCVFLPVWTSNRPTV